MAGRSRIALPCTFSNDTFARHVPFGDGREIVVRRGAELGSCHYGFEKSRRTVTLHGVEVSIVRYEALLSPPPLAPGQAPIGDELGAYRPLSDVVFLPDAEIVVRHRPDGFDDREVERILAAIEIDPQEP